jgi:hypothetical protein
VPDTFIRGWVDFSDLKGAQVRLVHQSLRECIFQVSPRDWRKLQSDQELSDDWSYDWQEGAKQRTEELEGELLKLCVSYLLMDSMDSKPLIPEDQRNFVEAMPFDISDFSPESDQHEDAETGYFDPASRGFGELFTYASCHWRDHYSTVNSEGGIPLVDIIELCQSGTTRLHNWVDQAARPTCSLESSDMNNKDNRNTFDPFIVSALDGSETGLNMMLSHVRKQMSSHDTRTSDFLDLERSLQRTMDLATESTYISVPKVHALFYFHKELGLISPLRLFCFRVVRGIKVEFYEERLEGIVGLVSELYEDMVEEKWGNELLCAAAGSDCLPMIRQLFHGAASNEQLREELLRDVQDDRDPKKKNHTWSNHQAVGSAVHWGHTHIVRYLLDQPGIEAHLRHRNAGGYNVLHLAAKRTGKEML